MAGTRSDDPKDSFWFRDATDRDVEAVVAIEREVYGSTAWSRDTVRREIASQRTDYVVAGAAGIVAIVGYGGLLFSSEGSRADIQTITVSERWRRRGLGRALATKLLSLAAARGVNEVFLEVRDDNPLAQALYRSLGFDRVGVRRVVSSTVEIMVVVMRLKIDSGSRGYRRARSHDSGSAA